MHRLQLGGHEGGPQRAGYSVSVCGENESVDLDECVYAIDFLTL